MKNTKNALLSILCVVFSIVILSCGTSGPVIESTLEDYGEGVPFVGEWAVFTDVANGGSSTVAMEEIEIAGAPAWRFTGNITDVYAHGFAGWSLTPDEATLDLLKTARSVSFNYIGDGNRQTFKFRISDVTDNANHEHHFFTEAGVTMREMIPIRFLRQPGWGRTVELNQENVVDVSWQTHENWRPGEFEITIWNIRVHP
jgi:hypothetical protein